MFTVAINGFGRIGRNFFRASYRNPEMKIVAINDVTDAATLAHLLKYDSVFGRFQEEVKAGEGWIEVAGQRVQVTAIRNPEELPGKRWEWTLFLKRQAFSPRGPMRKSISRRGPRRL